MTTARNAAEITGKLDTDTGVRLQKLVTRARNQHLHTQMPARQIQIEIDGSAFTTLETASANPSSLSYELPPWSRSLCLRDENGRLRAHILVQEQQFERAPFDHGRLLVSVARNDNGGLTLTLENAHLRDT